VIAMCDQHNTAVLTGEVLQHSRQVDRCTSTNTRRVLALLQIPAFRAMWCQMFLLITRLACSVTSRCHQEVRKAPTKQLQAAVKSLFWDSHSVQVDPHRATRPTGNCRPALDDWLTAFLAVLPLPRPDMVTAGKASRRGVR
jgi:hypothetical protein